MLNKMLKRKFRATDFLYVLAAIALFILPQTLKFRSFQNVAGKTVAKVSVAEQSVRAPASLEAPKATSIPEK